MTPEYFWWGPMWVFPMVMPIVMIVVLVLCLYFIFSRGRPPGEHPPVREETPLEILKKRYAKGEVTKEEFEQMKKDILN